MKIAIISHLYPTEINPHQGKFIQDHVELLNSVDGITVDLIVPTPYSLPFTKRWQNNHSQLIGQNSIINRVYYLSLPAKKTPKVIRKSLSNKISSFLENNNYDLIHIHWLYPDGLAIPTLKNKGYKTVLTIHGSDWYQTFDNPVLKPLIEQTLQTSDHLLYSGPKLQEDIEKLHSELANKSTVAFNIVDTEKYKPVSIAEKKELKTKLGWEESKIHTLTVANIRHEKGVDLLVDTVSKNENLSGIHFHIIGSKDESDYAIKVMEKIKTNPYKNIEYIHPVSPSDLIPYYQAADFYILPSRREGFNVSILEAASCGLPLLCTDVGGNRRVTELEVGFIMEEIFNHSSSEILKMAINFKKYETSKIHQYISSNFDKKVFLKKLLKIYSSVSDL